MGRIVGFFKKAFSFDRLIGLGFLAALLLVLAFNPYPVQLLRLKTFDYYQKLEPRPIPPAAEKPVTIIDIDEKSLQNIGQWPWSRSVIATMVKNLQDMGASIVAFDVVFAEPDRTNPSDIAKTVAGLDEETKSKLEKLPSNDQILASVIARPCPIYGKLKKSCVIMGQAGHRGGEAKNVDQPIKKSIAMRGKRGMQKVDPRPYVPELPALIRNIPIFERASVGQGFFSLEHELDGVVRRVPTLFKYKNDLYTALSVEMLRVAFNRPTIVAFMNENGMEKIGVTPKFIMPTDSKGRVWPYFSRSDPSKYVSAYDVIQGKADPNLIKGRMTIIGTSAVGLLDIRATPIDARIPGVEIHAQVIEAAAKGYYLNRPLYMNGAEWTIILIVGLLMIWLVPKIGAKWTLLLFLFMAGGSVGTSWYLFTEQRVLFDPVFGTASILLLYTLLTYTGYAKEEAQRRQTRDAFSKYLSPDMVARVAADPSSLKLGGEQRELTLLFSDVRGFTTISEQFSPEGLTDLINKLLTPLTNVILSNQGTVDKYMGDAVMAFWNAPLDDPDHPRHACLSAIGMLAEIPKLNARLEEEAKIEGRKHIPMQVGLGVNTGMGVVGNVGSDQRFDYSVLGDCVNMAARFEGQTKDYGVDILIGQATRERVPEMATIELDLIQVKGKTVGVPIYALLGDETVAARQDFQELKAAVDEAVAAYRKQDWATAKAKIEEARAKLNGYRIEGTLDLLKNRIAEYEINPPSADWDGVFIATTK
ncbi:MAG: adenylate/guanylate cyclase domain-containing protein [Rhodospirillales bacterium]